MNRSAARLRLSVEHAAFKRGELIAEAIAAERARIARAVRGIELSPCACDPAWTDRQMHAPDCFAIEDAVMIAVVLAIVEGQP